MGKRSFVRSRWLLYVGRGRFLCFVLFCSFKISSQNQRFPNDCINSKQTNKPKTKGVFSTKPICEAGLAGTRVSASCQPGGASPGPGPRGCPGRGGAAPAPASKTPREETHGPGAKSGARALGGGARGFAGGLRS